MRRRAVRHEGIRWRGLEALTAGLAYGTGLCCASVCLVASFRPADLGAAYWRDIPWLRTDTCGIAALLAGAACFTTSEYLRLRRRQDEASGRRRLGGTAELMVLAMAETVAVVATGLVVYVSVNAVTHPATLAMRASHLLPEPAEGTLRIAALFMCACSIGVVRYLMISRAVGRGTRAAPVLSSTARDSRDDVPRDEAVCDAAKSQFASGTRNKGFPAGAPMAVWLFGRGKVMPCLSGRLRSSP